MAGGKGMLIWFFLIFSIETYAFNLDTAAPIVKNHSPDSYFGYSVAQHTITGVSGMNESVILVGAPRANVTDPNQRDIVRPGAIYKCPVSSLRDDCDVILIDEPGDTDDKEDKWLGVSVSSQNSYDGKAVACAHRYKKAEQYSVWGPGICAVMTNLLDEDQFLEPCYNKDTSKGHGTYGFCQVGASVTLSDDGDVLVGSPGPYNWRGAAFKNIVRESLEDFPQWYSSPVEDATKQKPEPKPVPKMYYSFMGMSTAILNENRGNRLYVVGAPRSEGTGQIFMFSQGDAYLENNPDDILTGDQFGSGFGYALAVVDINGDRWDDLVVGAPFYWGTDFGGAIFVYLSDGGNINSETEPVMVKSPKLKAAKCEELDCQNSRFGFSLARVGDVDLDGYEDLAVGAPYEGDGAVYIFRGSNKGIRTTPSQRIQASQLLTAGRMSSFGSSLSGGVDMDDSGYPDLVVGSFESGKMLLFRSRPVINVMVLMEATPKQLDPKQTDCPFSGATNMCFKLRISFKFTAKPDNRFSSGIKLVYTLDAEKDRVVSRATFKGSGTSSLKRTINLDYDTPNVEEPLVHLQKSTSDYLNPVQISLTYNLKDRGGPTMNEGDNVPDMNDYPVMNEATAFRELMVPFKKNCGMDEKCQSNLNLKAMFNLDKDPDGDYTLKVGVSDEIELTVIVQNLKEDAHEAYIHVSMPKPLSFVGATKDGAKTSCTLKEGTISCLAGNPLQEDEKVMFKIRMDPSNIQTTQVLNIHVKANTTSSEVDTDDDETSFRLKVVIESDLSINGYSEPTEVAFSGEVVGESAMQTEEDIGSSVTHNFLIRNIGKGTIGNSTVEILWPYEVENGYPQGKHLLYLMQDPIIDRPGRCSFDPKFVNPLGLELSSGPSAIKTLSVQGQDERSLDASSYSVEDGSDTERSQRVKRDGAIKDVRDQRSGKVHREVHLSCRGEVTAKCFPITCILGRMRPEELITIKMRARLWNSTFIENYRDIDYVRIYSYARLQVDYTLNVKDTNKTNDEVTIRTSAIPDLEIVPPPRIKLWVIILAVCGGLLLLILLIFLLYKCGFFKRQKPGDMPEHKGTLQKKKKGNKASYYEDPYN